MYLFRFKVLSLGIFDKQCWAPVIYSVTVLWKKSVFKKKCFWCKIACFFFNKMLHTCYFKEFHAQGRRTMSRSWTVLCNWIRLPVQVLGSVDVWVGGWSGVSVCILSCLCPHLLFGHPALPPPYPSLCHPPPPLELIHFASSLSFLLRHPLTFSPLTFSSLLLFSAHCHCHFTCPQTTLL